MILKFKTLFIEMIHNIIGIFCDILNWLDNNKTPILGIKWFDFITDSLLIILFAFSSIILFISFLKIFLFSFNYWMNW